MNKKTIIIVVLLLAVIGIGLLIFLNNSGFRVVSRDPSGDVALSSTQISFTLSDEIQNKDDSTFSISPDIDGSFSVDGAVVTFKPTVTFEKDTVYKVSFSNIVIASSKERQSTTTTFTAKYVGYDKLSQAEQERQQQRTNPLYERFPITQKVLPHNDLEYKIEYVEPLERATQLSVTVTPLISIGSHETNNEYNQRLLDVRTAALQYIKDNDFNPDDLLIYYNDPYLAQFNANQDGEEFSPPIQ